MFFVQLCWIFKINLKNPSILCCLFFPKDLLLCGHDTLSFEISFREWLAHCPAVKVVCVEINDVFFRFSGVIVRCQRVVCLGVSLAYHRDSTPHALFHEEMHFKVCQELQFDSRLFQKRVPGQARRREIMRWI